MRTKLIKKKQDLIEALKKHTKFERDVYLATFDIPKGKVSTYKHIAKKIGRPKAYRAVANALYKNPFSPVVPCHRVVSSDGSFSGDEESAERRRKMVEREGVLISNNKVKLIKDIVN